MVSPEPNSFPGTWLRLAFWAWRMTKVLVMFAIGFAALAILNEVATPYARRVLDGAGGGAVWIVLAATLTAVTLSRLR